MVSAFTRRPRKTPGSRPRSGEEGYNLVVLMMLITLMSVALSLALPAWSTQAKREKERELVFRGLQYAEAVRVFQARHGRLPTSLDELVEVEPRSIRQLFPDPMSETGEWGLLVQSNTPRGRRGRNQGRNQGGQDGQGGQQAPEQGNPPGQGRQQQGQGNQQGQGQGQNAGGQNQPDPANSSGGVGINPALTSPTGARMNVVKLPPGEGGREEGFGRRNRVTAGPIVGVYSAVDEESLMVWNGQSNYQEWEFRVDILPTPVVLGGDSPIQRANSGLLGRPWPEGLQPENVGAGGIPGGQDLTGGSRRGNRRGSQSRGGRRGDRN